MRNPVLYSNENESFPRGLSIAVHSLFAGIAEAGREGVIEQGIHRREICGLPRPAAYPPGSHRPGRPVPYESRAEDVAREGGRSGGVLAGDPTETG